MPDNPDRKNLTRYLSQCQQAPLFFDTKDALEAVVSAADNGTIVVLCLNSVDENEKARRSISAKNQQIRFLSIVAEIEGHHGCILPNCFAVQSFPLLPSELIRGVAILAGRASPDISTDGSIDEAPASPENEGEGRSILLVEDNEINQQVILTQVRLLGHDVQIAENGAKGLEMWESGQYDLVLADCHMPEMDGFEMTRKIRQREAITGVDRTPIVAITANALEGESEKCFTAGMDDFLSKPVELARLRNALENWLPTGS